MASPRAHRFPLALLALAGLACQAQPLATGEPAQLERPVVERLSAQQLRIRWPASFSTGPVHVASGPAPDRIQREIGVAQGGQVELARADGGPIGLTAPLYFELRAGGDAAPVVVGERRLPLQGADNFRDLGGYATAQGRRVRWGVLFRSNEIADLTASDLAYLERTGLRLVCDLRTQGERAAKPDPDVPGSARLALPVAAEGVEADLMRDRILSGGIAALSLELTMRRAYRSFVTDDAQTWASLLRRLADPASLPALVHCTAGKDRTGFAAAVVLLALGVPLETVFEDYLLTNRYQADYRAFVLRWVPLASLFRTQSSDVLPLLEARRAYLETSIDAMREQNGSVEGYLQQSLGLDASLRAALAANLLL